MALNIGKEIAALKRMTVTQLRAKHVEVFGERTRSGHKDYLVKRIAWRLQAQAEGGLSDRACKRAMEIHPCIPARARAGHAVPGGSRVPGGFQAQAVGAARRSVAAVIGGGPPIRPRGLVTFLGGSGCATESANGTTRRLARLAPTRRTW